MPSVLPTGDTLPVPGGGQRPRRIPGVWARSEEPSWEMLPRHLKWLGLAHEDGTGPASLSALCRTLLEHEESVKQTQRDVASRDSHLNMNSRRYQTPKREESHCVLKDCRNRRDIL